MLYYFTASDKEAQKHFFDTIKNSYHIKPLLKYMNEEVVDKLKRNSSDEYVHMWGATPGKSNISRWNKLKEGDEILAYSKGVFYYSGTIFAKTRNSLLAQEVWGTNKLGQAYEYVYFIKDLKPVNIDTKRFARFFGYKANFTPQGFNNIKKDLLDTKMQRYNDLRELIYDLNHNFFLSEDDEIIDSYQEAIDSDYSKIVLHPDEGPEPRKEPKKMNGKNIWPRNPKKAKEAIKKAKFKCEIDNSHETFFSESSKNPFMEAHHLIPMHMQHEFEVNLDKVNNIVSLCPNCHRKIHYSNSQDKKILLEKLFNQRKRDLLLIGIDIGLEYLLNSYAIFSGE
ncbi:HNH endonuclease [Bacillus velezensis]|uniref:HNH endonuclease n=1 Tax=Bacillus velezensis TaxID=492670 RepID=UPI001EE7EC27|nr:HNH endonuclease [Bacillus velezensis]